MQLHSAENDNVRLQSSKNSRSSNSEKMPDKIVLFKREMVGGARCT